MAVKAIQEEGNDQIVLLHCVSQYPAQFEDLNLRAMQTLAQAFEVPVGFSDHTMETANVKDRITPVLWSPTNWLTMSRLSAMPRKR
jgi:hypothetical protein